MINSEPQNIEYEGFWWLPERPEIQIPGTLKFAKGKMAELICLDEFPGYPVSLHHMIKRPQTPQLVNGKGFYNGHWKDITLFSSTYNGSSQVLGTTTLQRVSLEIHFVLIGHHFSSIEEIRFLSFEMDFLHMREWVNVYPLTSEREVIDNKINFVSHKFTSPNLQKINIKHLNAELSFNISLHENRIRNYKYEMWYQVPFKLTLEEPQSLEWFLKVAGKLQILMTLLVGYSTNTISYKGYVPIRRSENSSIYDSGEVEIYFSLSFPWAEHAKDGISPLTNYRELNEFPILLSNWFEKFDMFGKAIHLFNTHLFEKDPYIHLRFLRMAQAAETVHRELHGDTRFSDKDLSEYNILRENLLGVIKDKISPNFYQSLESKLEHIPATTLRKRISELYKPISIAISKFIPDIESFSELVLNTRDYGTHHIESLAEKSAKPEDFPELNIKLEILLTATFLHQAGMDVAQIKYFFEKSRKYNWLSEC